MEKSEMFALVIDQETDFMLNLMTQWAMKNDGFLEDLQHFGLLETFHAFGESMNEGTKKVRWCNHPDCRGRDATDCEYKA